MRQCSGLWSHLGAPSPNGAVLTERGRNAEMGFMQADLRPGDLDHQDVVQLLHALDEEIRARYDEPVEDFVLKLDPEEVAPGHGAFVVAWADEKAVGCGAVRLIDNETAELSRHRDETSSSGRRHGQRRDLFSSC